MKLSYEDKVKIYEMRKSGVTWSQIHDQFGVNTNNLIKRIKAKLKNLSNDGRGQILCRRVT